MRLTREQFDLLVRLMETCAELEARKVHCEFTNDSCEQEQMAFIAVEEEAIDMFVIPGAAQSSKQVRVGESTLIDYEEKIEQYKTQLAAYQKRAERYEREIRQHVEHRENMQLRLDKEIEKTRQLIQAINNLGE